MDRWNSAMINGLRHSVRVPLLLPLYLATLVLGLAQTWPVWTAAGNGTLRNPFLEDLATGGSDAMVNLLIVRPEIGANAGIWTLIALLLAGILNLLYAFFAGGMLSAAAGTRSFWAGCRRMFWSFVGLALLLGVLASLVIVAASVAAFFIAPVASVIVGLLLLVVLNTLGEYARAFAVARDRRNPFVLLWFALRFSARHVVGVVALLVLSGLLLALVLAASFGIMQAAGGELTGVFVQQLTVLGLVWLKVLRLVWALEYVRSHDPQAHVRPSEAQSTPAYSIS